VRLREPASDELEHAGNTRDPYNIVGSRITRSARDGGAERLADGVEGLWALLPVEVWRSRTRSQFPIELADTFGLEVIADGFETADVGAMLTALDCDASGPPDQPLTGHALHTWALRHESQRWVA
jgi:hypothetical protein